MHRNHKHEQRRQGLDRDHDTTLGLRFRIDTIASQWIKLRERNVRHTIDTLRNEIIL